jgi:RecA/RadA recombinase
MGIPLASITGAPAAPIVGTPVVRTKKSGAKVAVRTLKQADSIDALVADLNKKMKGLGRIDRGKDISYLDPPRRRSGILSIDVLSNGGLPAGSIIQYWGPYSSGKTSSLLRSMSVEQMAGRSSAFAAGEGFSKDWARHQGLYIPYSDEEYEIAEDKVRHGFAHPDTVAQMRLYDAWATSEEGQRFGTICVVQHMHGDGLLEATFQCVRSNLFSIVGVDSLAVLKNTRQLEDAEVGDEERGGGGQISMFNRFMCKVFSAMNTKYDDTNTPNMYGERANETALVCLNQARIKFGAQGPGGGKQYQPVGGEGLLHAWQFSLFFQQGDELGKTESIDGSQRWVSWGIEVTAKVTKSKISPKGRPPGRWDLYTDDHAGFRKGQVDQAKEARFWGVFWEVIHHGGSGNYTLPGGYAVRGKENLDAILIEDPTMRMRIEEEVIKRCRNA